MDQRRAILKNTAALTFAQIAEKVSTIVLSFVVARTLGASALGVYSAALVFYGLISVAAGMGATDFLVREISRDLGQSRRYLVHVSAIGTALSLLLTAFAWRLVPLLGYSPELAAGVHVVIFALWPGVLRTIEEAVFVAHQRVEFIAYSAVMAAVCNLTVGVYLLRRGYGAIGLLISFAAVQYVLVILYSFFIRRYLSGLRCRFELSFVRKLLGEMKAFSGSSLLGGFFARPEILLLSLLRNEAQIGFYSAALKLVDLWQLFPQAYMANVFPVLSRSYHRRDNTASEMIERSTTYLLAMSLPLSAGIFVAARPIIGLVYGPGFEASVWVLRLLAVYIPLAFMFELLWRLLVARGQQNLNLRVQAVTIVARLGGGCALIYSLGFLGAAIITPASLLLHNSLLLLHIRRYGARIPFFRAGWRFAVATLCMALVTWVVIPHWQLWLTVSAATATYAITLLLLNPTALYFFNRSTLIAQVPQTTLSRTLSGHQADARIIDVDRSGRGLHQV
jgi:O-antigen/teichoic acid export membrane protein